MTVTPGSRLEEVRHAVARIIDPNCWWDDVPPNDHQQRKCNRALAKADEVIVRLAAKPAEDPADVWDAYCAEVPAKRRSPQGALAFGFEAGAKPAEQRERAATIQECAKIARDETDTWIKGEATTAIGQAFQRACRQINLKISALSTTGAPKP